MSFKTKSPAAAPKPPPSLEEILTHTYKTYQSSKRLSKAFAPYLGSLSTEALVAKSIQAFTPSFTAFLRRDLRTWTLEQLEELATQPDLTIAEKREVYLLLAKQWGLRRYVSGYADLWIRRHLPPPKSDDDRDARRSQMESLY